MTVGVDAGSLARSRFALSRVAELTNGLEVLSHPERAPYARRWVELTRPRVDVADLEVLLGLVDHASWYVPDFLVPVPGRYSPTLAAELDAVAATPPEQVRYQLELAFRIGAPPPEVAVRSGVGGGRDPRAPLPDAVADALAAGESTLAGCVAEQLARCWRRVMAASWPALHRILDEDVRHHTAAAGRSGFGGIVAGLHPHLGWDGRRLMLRRPVDVGFGAAESVVFLPSVFLPWPAIWLETTGPVMVGYPARGRGQVWAVPEGPAAGATLLGSSRAVLLGDLGTPRSTTELAARHRISPATVSYHLGRLHRAGLVTRRQAGHSVLYQRTERAAALLAAIDPDDAVTDPDDGSVDQCHSAPDSD